MNLRHAIGALLVLQLCAGVSPAEAQKGRRNDVITAEEIAKSSANNAYDLVKSLRPAWLRPRGISTGRPTVDAVGEMGDPGGGMGVYVDGVRVGGLDQLSNVEAQRIQEMRFLNASDATLKYGTGHTQGAIEVTTKR